MFEVEDLGKNVELSTIISLNLSGYVLPSSFVFLISKLSISRLTICKCTFKQMSQVSRQAAEATEFDVRTSSPSWTQFRDCCSGPQHAAC